MFKLLQNSRFFQLLFQIDCRQAQEAAQSCCRACGGKLHRADYPRKARGVPHKLTEQWDRRYSLCCSTEGCRLRHTPISVRFLERKVYSEVFIVRASALMKSANERRAGDLECVFVSIATEGTEFKEKIPHVSRTRQPSLSRVASDRKGLPLCPR
jgi:hypothetical protein